MGGNILGLKKLIINKIFLLKKKHTKALINPKKDKERKFFREVD